MFERLLNNRFLILYLAPFILGSFATLSFQPFNYKITNFIILPIFFYLVVYINKKSKITYRKKPYKKNLFIFGLLFGFGFYLSGISWITNSLTFDEIASFLASIVYFLIFLYISSPFAILM